MLGGLQAAGCMGEPPFLLRGHSTKECSSIFWSGRKGRTEKGTGAVEKGRCFVSVVYKFSLREQRPFHSSD